MLIISNWLEWIPGVRDSHKVQCLAVRLISLILSEYPPDPHGKKQSLDNNYTIYIRISENIPAKLTCQESHGLTIRIPCGPLGICSDSFIKDSYDHCSHCTKVILAFSMYDKIYIQIMCYLNQRLYIVSSD